MEADVKTLSVENVVEPLTAATAVGCSEKCFNVLMCLVRRAWGGRLHCQEGNYPSPDRRRHTLQSSGADCSVFVCDTPLKPSETPLSPPLPPTPPLPHPYRCPETDPGLLWTYAEEEHCKNTEANSRGTVWMAWRTDGQTDETDWWTAATPTHGWFQAESSRETVKGELPL